MTYSLAIASIFLAFSTPVAAFFLLKAIRRRRVLARLARMPFPVGWRDYLRHTPHYRHLNETQRIRIERDVLRFVYTRRFIAVRMRPSDEMKVIIAFYACLMVLHREGDDFRQVPYIYVYDDNFILPDRHDRGGIFSEEQLILEGQATVDAVVLSWQQARREAYGTGRHNVIIHEFAHALDMFDGHADGVPALPDALARRWIDLSQQIFNDYVTLLNHHGDRGRFALIDPYAATNEAEFFAVICELFFMQPGALKNNFPELYTLLAEFYNWDTAKSFAW